MAITLGICPCDTERDPLYWENFRKALQEIFQEEVILYTFPTFKEELEFLESNQPDLYLASPDIANFLLKQNYLPYFRFAYEEDNLILITRKDFRRPKKHFKVALPHLDFFYTGFLLSSLPLEDLELIFVSCFRDGIEKLLNKELDYLFLYERFYQNLPKEVKEVLKKEETYEIPFYHYLMVKKSFYQKHKEAFQRFKKLYPYPYPLKRTSPKEIKALEYLLRKVSFVSQAFQNRVILEQLLEHPKLVIAIYREHFIFANRGTLEITGYDLKEILQMSPLDLVYEKDRPLIAKTLQKRLKGHKFPYFYPDLKIKAKSGKIIHLFCYTQTIFSNSKQAGLIIGLDITQQKQFETFYRLLREVNSLILHSTKEEELFSNLCRSLSEIFELKLAWVGKLSQDAPYLEPLFTYGEEKDFPQNFIIPYFENLKTPHPILLALQEGKIVINEFTAEFPFPEDFKKEMLKRNLLSCAIIPFYKQGKPYGILSLISPYPYYFTEDIREVLEEIQSDLSFALDKIEILKEHQLLYNVIEQIKEWVLITDQNGTILYASPFVSELSGYKPEEIIGQNPRIFKSGLHSQEFYETLWNTILSGKSFSTVIINRAKNGSLFKLEEAIYPVRLPDGEIRFVAIGKDVTKEEYLNKEIEFFKFYDPLTWLYNFSTFIFKVEEKIKESKDKISPLILMDIKNLSWINYTFGISAGDEVLKEVAYRLKEILTERDLLGRAGGDEFIIWIADLPKEEVIHKIIEKINFVMARPLRLKKETLNLQFNAAIVLYPRDGVSFNELFEKATLALNTAKKENQTFRFYDQGLGAQFEKFAKLEILIRKALKERLFVFHYQPYIELATGKICGCEALVRIKEGDKLYMPGEFIDYLESSPYLREFEEWVFQKAAEQIKKWNFSCSINISARTFLEKDFIERLKRIPKDCYPNLCIEITERTVIRDLQRAKEILTKLKTEVGPIKIALDDFGTGYSSLLELKELPVDVIKIDRSFVSELEKGKRELSIVKAIIDLSHSFDITVFAEGVETREQLQALDLMGCDYAMGFYISKPLPEEEMEALLFSKEKLKLW